MAKTNQFGRTVAITLILSCAVVGGYAGIFLASRDGLFDAIKVCIDPLTKSQCALGIPPSREHNYFNISAIDKRFAIIVEFFALGLAGETSLAATLSSAYMMAQFGASWCLIVLEGLRKGNSGTPFSWTGTVGIIFQGVSITIVAPLYLAAHLLLSPVSTTSDERDLVLADTLDLKLLPVSTFIGHIIPTICLALPAPAILSEHAKQLAIAFWQPFPLYQTIVHSILRLLTGTGPKDSRNQLGENRRALASVYKFILWLAITSHVTVVGVSLLSPWIDAIPTVELSSILVPDSLTNPPTLALKEPSISAASLKLIVGAFLQWDVYCACISLVIWAFYLNTMAQGVIRPFKTLAKTILWISVGGPMAAASVLLWERDEIVAAKTTVRKRK